MITVLLTLICHPERKRGTSHKPIDHTI